LSCEVPEFPRHIPGLRVLCEPGSMSLRGFAFLACRSVKVAMNTSFSLLPFHG
jgi:hypothetical protein